MAKRPAKQTSRPKRPRDVNQLAQHLVALSTGQIEEPKATPSEISRVMAELGRRGGKVGGKARAAILSAEERSDAAAKAARARWSKKKAS